MTIVHRRNEGRAVHIGNGDHKSTVDVSSTPRSLEILPATTSVLAQELAVFMGVVAHRPMTRDPVARFPAWPPRYHATTDWEGFGVCRMN